MEIAFSLSHRQVAKSLSISLSVVSRYANRAAQMGIISGHYLKNGQLILVITIDRYRKLRCNGIKRSIKSLD
ncbi:protein of unknown function [Moritella yayanosii]|uniref:Uncharacterized protein n=1 Tax=Moritella yayanosii TaxID=69539 RepID=A0A330LNZ3_9GAMM|nr:protein of unknown function [Moritella yayanosii]